MTADRSTVRGREIGRQLVAAYTEAGLDERHLRTLMQWSPSRWSRTMSGQLPIAERDAATILGLCGVVGATRDVVLELCQADPNAPVCLPRHRAWPIYLAQASTATRVFEFHPCIVPWVLQTHEYTRALVSEGGRPLAKEEINVRQEATRLLDSARVDAVIHEWALCTPVQDDQVMTEQLHHLLRMSARPSTTLRVLPSGQCVHLSQYGGFTKLEFAEHQPAVYREHYVAGVLTEDRLDLSTYKSIASALTVATLSERQSLELINRTAVELYSGG